MIVKKFGSQMGSSSVAEEGGKGRGCGRGGSQWREKLSVIKIDVGVEGPKRKIKVERRRDHDSE